MEFLLLLSAFISALTGAITGVRCADMQPAQVVVASSTARAAQPASTVSAATRPAAVDFAPVRSIGVGKVFAIAAVVPLYMSRLRV